MQGFEPEDRKLLDAAAVAGHLVAENSMFAFLAAHRAEVFRDADYADLFAPPGLGRPSIPATQMAAVLTLQVLHDYSDRETAEAVRFDVRWKAAIGAALDDAGFDPAHIPALGQHGGPGGHLAQRRADNLLRGAPPVKRRGVDPSLRYEQVASVMRVGAAWRGPLGSSPAIRCSWRRRRPLPPASPQWRPLRLLLAVGSPVSSALTRELLGWQPTQPGLIETSTRATAFNPCREMGCRT